MTDLAARVHELERRVANLIRPGVITEADYAQARVRVRVGTADADEPAITNWLPWLTTRAGGDVVWHPPEVGEQVLVVAPSGELAQGYVLPAIYSQAHPANADTAEQRSVVCKDGAHRTYQRDKHVLTEFVPGDIRLECEGGLTIKTSKDCVIEAGGNVSINGKRIDFN